MAQTHAGPGALEIEELIEEFNELTATLARDSEKRAKSARALHWLATHDGLTELYNRRYFDEILAKELSRATRYNASLALVLFDVDHFKSYNDRFGHQAGDQVLRDIGGVILTLIRGSDIACRYGGEEFAIILPSTRREDAMVVAEKLRRAIEITEFFTGEGVPLPAVTVSLGVSDLGSSQREIARLIANADTALYAAKAAGRNRALTEPPLLARTDADSTSDVAHRSC